MPRVRDRERRFTGVITVRGETAQSVRDPHGRAVFELEVDVGGLAESQCSTEQHPTIPVA